MTLQDLKNTSIPAYLESIGFRPQKESGGSLWYLSPLRDEKTPSFKVNTERNLWYDFGIGKGGDLPSFLMLYYGFSSYQELLKTEGTQRVPLTMRHHAIPRLEAPGGQRPPMTNFTVRPLSNPKLLEYARQRGISLNIACRYLQEAHYTVGGRRFYSLAFENSKGGFELRNPFFKGCMAPKTYTLVKMDPQTVHDTCAVFEGFFDFLSFVELARCNGLGFGREYKQMDFLVLNSVTTLSSCPDLLRMYSQVLLFLDNDEAGDRAKKEALKMCAPNVACDLSYLYAECGDLNEFWISFRDEEFSMSPS